MRSVALFFAGLSAGALLWGQSPSQSSIVDAKLANVVLTTVNLDSEAVFFEKTFGFKVFYHDKTSRFLKTGSANLVLVRASSPKLETKQVCLDVTVPSLSVAARQLMEAGVKIDDSQHGILKLSDPDGNLVEIVKG